MESKIKHISLCVAMLGVTALCVAQDRIHYTGSELSNPAYHDGQLSPVVGVHNIQVMRANREHPDSTNGDGWTYNHQPMLVYWNGNYYMEYISNKVDEHVPPCKTLYVVSKDGYSWSAPRELFPIYNVPEGYKKPERDDVAHNLTAIMHQRVGFFVSKEGRLLAIGNYGVAYDKKDDPNDGNGIGRVVREIKKDGTLGEVFFIYYNHAFNAKNTDFRYFAKSRDKGFVRACNELLANPLQRMQWVEEADREEPLIPLKTAYKAFNYYTLPNGHIAALWKHALTSISTDGGQTWAEPVQRAKGFVNSNAKIWGQRLSDGMYATVYNPSEYRWPLAISLSSDGLEYTTLNLIHGEITPMRYGGNYKSYGPQYVRGIQECNGVSPDGDLWVAYSVDKEDMWVSRVKVPVQLKATKQADDNLDVYTKLSELTDWNIYSPLWASVSLEKKDNRNWLKLSDKDPFDYARIERKIPETKELEVSFDMQAGQNDTGILSVEFLDENGICCSRLEFTDTGILRCKKGSRYGMNFKYEAGRTYKVSANLSVSNRMIVIYVDGKKVGQSIFYVPVKGIERVAFKTGVPRLFPTSETPADQDYDLPNAGDQDKEAVYYISALKTRSLDDNFTSILTFEDYAHYVDYFNAMEDENIAQAIPNAASEEWMKRNVPLFDCPDDDFEEMYYYRWWTLRKHIKQTPVGYGMTEFLVNRSYADKYNLIACAVGHHIYESRWLRDTTYLDQIIRTWYRGNEGKSMSKMTKFSSWIPDAIYNRFLVQHDTAELIDLLQDMETEYIRWESTHRLSNGLYWQGDVQDGMEESISGGRKKQYARPTISSYMYGNAEALSHVFAMAGDMEKSRLYAAKADTLKNLVQTMLWNDEHQFFETRRKDTLAQVREAIGYIPWYFNLPDAVKYDSAWIQLTDEKGFSAPYGLTTAERRHPEFRTHGVGKCEWDGAIWPFATSQTLTSLINYMNTSLAPIVTDTVFYNQMKLYAESQHHRGRPYIGEYLDEVTGYWLKGDQERSRYYNHSTFNDMVVTGIVGLRPRADGVVEVNPLIPEGTWNYFCLDGIRYHGHNIAISWDKDGSHYHHGQGLRIFVDGVEVAHSNKMERLMSKICL